MAALRESLLTLTPLHLLAWGTLLGMELYQSQVMTKLCYLYLPTAQFTQLQRRVFPVYFALQTGLAALVALTYPPYSLASLFPRLFGGSGSATVSTPFWSAIAPLSLTLLTATLNYGVWGPRTAAAMAKRSHQETADGRRGEQAKDAPTEGMRQARRNFSRAHAMSIHLNAVGMLATVWYGLGFAGRFQLGR